MPALRFLPIILLACINQSFADSKPNIIDTGFSEINPENQSSNNNISIQKNVCGFADLFGLKSLCPPQLSDEEKENLKKQYIFEIYEDVNRRGLDWYWNPVYSCYKNSSKLSINYKYNPNIFSEDECLKTADNLKTQREINLHKQEQDRLQAIKQKENEENELKARELQKKAYYEEFTKTTDFNKLLMVGQILEANKKIESAQKEQKRQKEIGNQSGYVNTSAIYNAGVTIFDNKELKKQLFQDYKKFGGIAKNESDLIKLHDNCKQLNGLSVIDTYMLGADGWLVKWDEVKRNDVIATANCF